MIIAITVVIIIIILLILIIIIIINDNINNNGNISKNQVIWLKKCFLRLCLKVFKIFQKTSKLQYTENKIWIHELY